MQEVGGKEDTVLSREDLTLLGRELYVESLGHCQSIGNWMSFSLCPFACQTKGFLEVCPASHLTALALTQPCCGIAPLFR
jgi:hypothetical protein